MKIIQKNLIHFHTICKTIYLYMVNKVIIAFILAISNFLENNICKYIFLNYFLTFYNRFNKSLFIILRILFMTRITLPNVIYTQVKFVYKIMLLWFCCCYATIYYFHLILHSIYFVILYECLTFCIIIITIVYNNCS